MVLIEIYMKKIVFTLLIISTLISCSIKEKMIINSDGSGNVTYDMDFTEFLKTMNNLDKSSKSGGDDFFAKSDKDIDSIIHFKDFEKLAKQKGDTLTEEQKVNFERMKNFSMRIVAKKSTQEMKYSLYGNFKSVNELNELGSPIETVKEVSGGKKSTSTAGLDGMFNSSKTKMSFDGKVFTKIVEKKPINIVEEIEADSTSVEVVEDYSVDSTEVDTAYAEPIEELKSVEELEDVNSAQDEVVSYDEKSQEDEMSEKELKKMSKDFEKVGKLMKDGFKKSKYIVEYTFPKKIKKVNAKKYKLSKDKMSVNIEYSIEEYMDKPEELSLQIELE